MPTNEQYEYIKNILEEEFPDRYWKLQENGLLDTELQNMLGLCGEVFEELGFDESNRMLGYAVIGTIGEYFNEQQV